MESGGVESSSSQPGSKKRCKLPEKCIIDILKHTGPHYVSKLSQRGPAFYPDALWEHFLPFDYKDIISQSELFSQLACLSRGKLFFYLCDSPILIDQGKKMFWLRYPAGEICYKVGARHFSITLNDNANDLEWISSPDSGFPEAVKLPRESWCGIKLEINTRILSPKTKYWIKLLFREAESVGMAKSSVLASIGVAGGPTTREIAHLHGYVDSGSVDHPGYLEFENLKKWLNKSLDQLLETELCYRFIKLGEVKQWMNARLIEFQESDDESKRKHPRQINYGLKGKDDRFCYPSYGYFSHGDVRKWLNDAMDKFLAARKMITSLEELKVWLDGRLIDLLLRPEGEFKETCSPYPSRRFPEGGFELYLGEFYNDGGEDQELEISLKPMADGFGELNLIVTGMLVEVIPYY